MLMRTTDATDINRIFNHPAVRPFAVENDDQDVDLSAVVANPVNVSLVGEHGAIVFLKYCEGIYEVHADALPEGRGAWMKEFTTHAIAYVFFATDAVEMITQVPEGNIASKALVTMMGGRPQFERPACRFRGKMVPATIYALSIQDWSRRSEADGAPALRQMGIEPANEDHGRIAGIVFEMLSVGNIRKAVVFYNRWALSTRQQPIALVSEREIRIGRGLLTSGDDGLSFTVGQ